MNKTIKNRSLPSIRIQQRQLCSKSKRMASTIQKKQIKNKNSSVFMIGNYRVKTEDLLGRGISSKVYKGVHGKTGVQVALKVIDLSKIKTSVQKRFLQNQIELLSLLKESDNIIHLHEVIKTDQNIIIVTELCRQSLSHRMQKQTGKPQVKINAKEAIKIILQIMTGYLCMRAEGLVHRDIKPANIIFDKNGQAKLCDLGFAAKDQHLEEDKHINVGSPLYMPPQILKGNHYSSKADMWSIGVVFLEMLIGQLPWAGVKQAELRQKIMTINFQSIIPINLEVKWKYILKAMLQINPRKRIGSSALLQMVRQQNLTKCNKDKCANQVNEIQYITESLTQTSLKTDRSVSKSKKLHIKEEQSCLLKEYSQRIDQDQKQCYIGRKRIPYTPGHKSQRSGKSIKMEKVNQIKLAIKQHEELALKLATTKQDEWACLKKEQTTKLDFGRFAFKVISKLIKYQNNIYLSGLSGTEQLPAILSSFILKILTQVKEIKTDFGQKYTNSFKRSKEYQQIMKLNDGYIATYQQYFKIKISTINTVQSLSEQQIISFINQYLMASSNHLFLIQEQMIHSKLNTVCDEEICQFAQIIDLLKVLKKLLILKQEGMNKFVRFSNISQSLALSNCQKLCLSSLKKICKNLI